MVQEDAKTLIAPRTAAGLCADYERGMREIERLQGRIDAIRAGLAKIEGPIVRSIVAGGKPLLWNGVVYDANRLGEIVTEDVADASSVGIADDAPPSHDPWPRDPFGTLDLPEAQC